MEKITKYIALDGTMFEDEDACEEYEDTLLLEQYKDCLQAYDAEKTLMTNCAIADILYNAFYFVITSQKAWDWIAEQGERYDYSTPGSSNQYRKGLWIYENRSGEWYYWQDIFEEIQTLGRDFNQL